MKGLLTLVIVLALFMRVYNDRMVKGIMFYDVKSEVIIVEVPKKRQKESKPQTKKRGYIAFSQKMSKIESNHNIMAVNQHGMLGKYQFSPKTLKMLNIHIEPDSFLVNEALQDSAFKLNLRKNYNILRKYIIEHHDTIRGDIHITTSGILAGAHLLGPGGVMSWLRDDTTQRRFDGNGTHVEKYIRLFSNYDLTSALKRS